MLDTIEFNTEVLNGDDEEMRDCPLQERLYWKNKIKMEADIRQMLIPKDPQDEKTPYWKYVQEQEVMKLRCWPATWCVGTCAIASDVAGKPPF